MQNEKAVMDRLRSIAFIANEAASEIQKAKLSDFKRTVASIASDEIAFEDYKRTVASIAYDEIAFDLAQLGVLVK